MTSRAAGSLPKGEVVRGTAFAEDLPAEFTEYPQKHTEEKIRSGSQGYEEPKRSQGKIKIAIL